MTDAAITAVAFTAGIVGGMLGAMLGAMLDRALCRYRQHLWIMQQQRVQQQTLKEARQHAKVGAAEGPRLVYGEGSGVDALAPASKSPPAAVAPGAKATGKP